MTDMTDLRSFLTKAFDDSYEQGRKDALEVVVQIIKELRPAIHPLEVMGKPITTQEWFDVLAAAVQEKIK
jgi:hypothetical protein